MSEINVLLVDDEPDYREAVARRLSKRNMHPVMAGSGEEALRVLQTGQTVDVVVLDVKMPGMDGIQTLREIKKVAPLVEVVMLTGHANVEVALEGMEFGAFDYLMKPVDIEELVSKIQDAHNKKLMREKRAKRQKTAG